MIYKYIACRRTTSVERLFPQEVRIVLGEFHSIEVFQMLPRGFLLEEQANVYPVSAYRLLRQPVNERDEDVRFHEGKIRRVTVDPRASCSSQSGAFCRGQLDILNVFNDLVRDYEVEIVIREFRLPILVDCPHLVGVATLTSQEFASHLDAVNVNVDTKRIESYSSQKSTQFSATTAEIQNFDFAPFSADPVFELLQLTEDLKIRLIFIDVLFGKLLVMGFMINFHLVDSDLRLRVDLIILCLITVPDNAMLLRWTSNRLVPDLGISLPAIYNIVSSVTCFFFHYAYTHPETARLTLGYP